MSRSATDSDETESLGKGRASERAPPDAQEEFEHVARASVADRHIGARIRERRVMLGLSQQQLGQMIGVTYQQAHKYERGLNRISAGRLFEISQMLAVPISWFFEGLAAETGQQMNTRQRMCLELARNFAAIGNERHQEALSQMARALAAQSVEEALGTKRFLPERKNRSTFVPRA